MHKLLNFTTKLAVISISLLVTSNCYTTPTSAPTSTFPSPTETLSAYPFLAPLTQAPIGGYPIHANNPTGTLPPPPAITQPLISGTDVVLPMPTPIPVTTVAPPTPAWIMRYEKEINRQTDGLRDISIQSIAISPDGKSLAVGGGSPYYVVTVLELATGNVIQKIASHQSEKEWTPVKKIVFDPVGTKLYGVGHDQLVRIWDVKTGLLIRNLAWHTDKTVTAIFTPDGLLAVSGLDTTIRFWDENGERVRREGRQDEIVVSMLYWTDGYAEARNSTQKTLGYLDIETQNGGLGMTYFDSNVLAIAYQDQKVAALVKSLVENKYTLSICSIGTGRPCEDVASHSYAGGLATLPPNFIYGVGSSVQSDDNKTLFSANHMISTILVHDKKVIVGTINGYVSLWTSP